MGRWWSVHKWSSLVCAAFLLVSCVTGLPLIFHAELDRALGAPGGSAISGDRPDRPLDELTAAARAAAPGRVVQIAFQDPAKPGLWQIVMGAYAAASPEEGRIVAVDGRSSRVLGGDAEAGITTALLHLHSELYAGLPGKLFLGLTGIAFLLALVSGVVVYARVRRGLAFGTVRTTPRRRLWWRDVHSLVGAVTLGWAAVVGITGVINTWADLAIKLWSFTELADMTKAYRDRPPPARLTPVDDAVATAVARMPGTRPYFVAWPGTMFSDAHHYAVFVRGTTPFTARLFRPVLIDAGTGAFTASRDMPLYVKMLLVSQPLHFGDYGGLPLKLVWAILDLLTIGVLGSGIWLWLRRRGPPEGLDSDRDGAPA